MNLFFRPVAFLAAVFCLALTATGQVFPVLLFDNTTGEPNSIFLGPPDDTFFGLGGQRVTYDFGLTPIFNGAGQDFNVYEVDFGAQEFNLMSVFVSNDGVTFFDVKPSEAVGLSIPGDAAHGDPGFKRSYDLGASPLTLARFLRIDGVGTGAAGPALAFDLDAVGALNTTVVSDGGNAVPEGGASLVMMVLGLAGLGICREYTAIRR